LRQRVYRLLYADKSKTLNCVAASVTAQHIEAPINTTNNLPDTCRTFPIEQGMLYDVGRKKETPVHFFRPPKFCRGQYEKKEWTLPAWTRDQEAELYHQMTIRWAGLKRLFQKGPWGFEGPALSR